MQPTFTTSMKIPLFGENGLVALPPSPLFLDDDELQSECRDKLLVCENNQHLHQPQRRQHTSFAPSVTSGWWVDESAAAHVVRPLTPLPYVRVTELMSLSSSEPQPMRQEGDCMPASQTDSLLDDLVVPSPPPKSSSKSPASSMSASRTSQGKRREFYSASDDTADALEDAYCAVECVLDERSQLLLFSVDRA
jgi:hypothetical protein